tara:strand:+ start:387 stop:506 length:120 start_codon:yes stop_codon:yes gene_type:complete
VVAEVVGNQEEADLGMQQVVQVAVVQVVDMGQTNQVILQ